MRTDMKRMGTKGQRAALMGALLAVVLGGTGCGDDECVDAFDCRDKGAAPAGQAWACVEEKCTQVVVDIEEDDAGTGTDAGTEADAGTGTDAGTETDGGTDTDGGTVACAPLPREQVLGTLQLQAGFSVAESADLSTEVLAVVSTPGPTHSLFGLRETATGRDVFALGTWPDVALGSAAIDTVIAPADRSNPTATFPSYYLAYDGTRLLAGYTKSGFPAPGSVAVVDASGRDATAYLNAPSNYTAAGTTDAFFVNGGGLDTVSGDLGIYALVTSAKPYVAVKVVDFPAQVGASGFTAVADNGISVFGYAEADTYVNVAHAVSNAKLGEALANRTPVVLTNEPKVDVGSDFNNAASFGNGVAVVRGAYGAAGFGVTDVSRFSLTPGLGGGQPISVGTRTAVLNAADACTNVDLLSSLGADLLVGVKDVNGRRLVRIRQGQ
ncbi:MULTISPECIES: hypothetical protein [unclassified Corallococcus]|uniref:hypothetical protein n=1 Tax=unclassified Corallococcus TaxID=2685029 RepID=UPI001A8E9C56|nr:MULTISPECIES: hypothetical protein [unclassified Corallococcus]MBN9682339.1 hypothetical protein [Corallococcus sp. NCSPR001]WAS86107.1 hypothetical protein O0N60_03835 [Corallococcus sp. NCRR]